MDESLKRRLVGVIVLVCLVVIFVPMLLEEDPVAPGPEIEHTNIPPRPQPPESFRSGQIRPLQQDPLALPREPEPLELPRPASLQTEPFPLPEPEPSPVEQPAPQPVSEPPSVVEQEPAPAPAPANKSAPPSEPASKPLPVPASKPPPTPKPAPAPIPKPAPAPKPAPKPVSKAPAPQAAAITSWVVQVASLSSSERANALVGDLRKAKYPAFQESVRIDGRRLYRVRIGPEADRRLAEAMANGVNKRFGLQSQVVSYP